MQLILMISGIRSRRLEGVVGLETEGVTVTVHEQDMSGVRARRSEASATTTGLFYLILMKKSRAKLKECPSSFHVIRPAGFHARAPTFSLPSRPRPVPCRAVRHGIRWSMTIREAGERDTAPTSVERTLERSRSRARAGGGLAFVVAAAARGSRGARERRPSKHRLRLHLHAVKLHARQHASMLRGARPGRRATWAQGDG